MSETNSIEPQKVRPQVSSHSSGSMGDLPTDTAQPTGPSPLPPVSSTPLRCSRLGNWLLFPHTTTTPAARVVSSDAAVSAVMRPPSMITAISLSEMARRSSAYSQKVLKMPRAPVGLAGAGITWRFSKRTSWAWSIRWLLNAGRPEATNEADPGVNWIPRLWLSEPPAGSSSMSRTSRSAEAQLAAKCMAVVEAPGEPWVL